MFGRVINPFDGAVELNVDGLTLSYKSVTYSGGLSRVDGLVINPMSIPVYATLRFSAFAPKPDTAYFNRKVGKVRCWDREIGHDTVSAVLRPQAAAPFKIVVPIPAGVDTSLIGWQVRVDPMLLRPGS